MKTQSTEQIGVCSWSLKATGPQDLAEKVNALALKRVQLGLTPHRNDPGTWDGVQETLRESGIEIVSGMFATTGEDYTTPATIQKTGGVILDEYWDENWALAKDAAATAKAMGLTQVSTHAGFLPHETTDPSFEKLGGRIVDLAKLFGDHGCTLMLETGQETADTLLVFLDEMAKRGADNLTINFDPANLLLYNMDEPIEAFRKLISRVEQVHVKDALRPAEQGQWGEEVVVGTGQVDWNAFVQILADADYAGTYIFEREAGDDRVGDIAKGIETLTAAMKAVCG